MTEQQSSSGQENTSNPSEAFYKQVLLHAAKSKGSWIKTPWMNGEKYSIALSAGPATYRVETFYEIRDGAQRYHLNVRTYASNIPDTTISISTDVDLETGRETITSLRTLVGETIARDTTHEGPFLTTFSKSKYDPGATHVFEMDLKRTHGVNKVSRITR